MRRLLLSLALMVPGAGFAFEMPEDQAGIDFITANVVSTFYHEVGHAVIDVAQLAVLGREEDAADTLSAILINAVWDEESATTLVYGTANAFLLYDAEAKSNGYETAYWDEHSLDLQRYYNLVCLFYGANPEMRDDDVKELELPANRAERCPDEFALAEESWAAMLEDLTPSADTKPLVLKDVDVADPVGFLIAEEVKTLNETYGLPQEVTVTVAECGEANAYYNPADKTITMCVEYAEDLKRLWLAQQE